MKNTHNMEKILDNSHIIKLLYRWKWPLVIVFTSVILLSSIFSGPRFIEPKYLSYAIVYPSNLIPYSSETETEQMLQIFRSDDLRDSIIRIFNYADYYNINTSEKYHYTRLIKIFQKNVKIRKTEFESVIIEAYDRDPERACEVVKTMMSLFNKKVRAMHREKSLEVVTIASIELEKNQKQIDSVTRIINDLSSEYFIIDFEAQAKEVTRGHLRTVDGSGAAHVNTRAVEDMKTNLETKGNEYLLYKELLTGLIDRYIELKSDYDVALRDVEKDLTYINVVSSPIPADKKTYPIRWLIVFTATLSVMFLATLIIVYIDKTDKHI